MSARVRRCSRYDEYVTGDVCTNCGSRAFYVGKPPMRHLMGRPFNPHERVPDPPAEEPVPARRAIRGRRGTGWGP
jgi:rRNA maturation protein Nop10